jgi:peptide deformylase
MSIKPVLTVGHPTLRLKAKELDLNRQQPFIEQLSIDLIDTMRALDGLGLAAPQIDESWQILAIERPKLNPRYPDLKMEELSSLFQNAEEALIVINPHITILDKETSYHSEGCLSVPGRRALVERPSHIKVSFYNRAFVKQELILRDFASVVFQHECDHLEGKLFIDLIST